MFGFFEKSPCQGNRTPRTGEKRSALSTLKFYWNFHFFSLQKELIIIPSTEAPTQARADQRQQELNHELAPQATLDQRIIVPRETIHNIPTLPRLVDLRNKDAPFLRANKTIGPFESVDDYLDLHFRLLKEDSLRTVSGLLI